jgi:beta-glucosidase
MKKLLLFLAIASFSRMATAQTPVYKDPKQSVDARVNDLLKRMTPEEKAGQLNQLNGGQFTGPAANDPGQKVKMQMIRDGKVGSMLNVIGARETRAVQEIAVKETHLGIPLLYGYDVIHGYKTIFPIPLAEACSWDLAAIEKNSSVAAKEAASAGIHWTFAPMCDISNDPRWGRVMEGAGEDPYLGGLISAARVRGLQGSLQDNTHVMSCIKHFAAYGAVESGREYNNVDVSRVALWNKYLPPYRAAVEAGAATVMNAFNVFEGVPASGNPYLVNDILRKQWGFKGIVVSDWSSFGEMITHGYASDGADAAYKALNAGSDMDMESKVVVENLPKMIRDKKIDIKVVDAAVGRILAAKFKLGLFEDPYKFSDEQRESATLFTAENRAQAREAAKRSIVLLKNDNNALPLNATGKKVAVIGSWAKSHDDMFDFWVAQGKSGDAVSIYDGLKANLPSGTVLNYADGYATDGTTNDQTVNEAVAEAIRSDLVVFVGGLSGKLAGEERSLANPSFPDNQIQLLKAIRKTGKPIILLIQSGRPLVLTGVKDIPDAILQCWILGTETGNAVADVVTGAYNPSGKTVLTFPYAVGQIPVYYNHFNTGRPVGPGEDGAWKSRYRDIPNDPLYPFGYGLSYTSFTYGGLKLGSSTIDTKGNVQVSVTVTNTGGREGEEVVQVYIRDIAASIIRPVSELKAFSKVSLRAGESRVVSFTLTPKDLSFADATGKPVIEPGAFKIMVGGNSRDVLSADLTVR